MRINADFTKRVAVHFDQTEWVASPAAGVERKMLDRIGEEVARATTIVRFAPGSAFSAHTHDGGEEYLVLDGVFQDETGDFPVGSYVRNPPTSSHTPSAAQGATILVKLHQFDPQDRTEVHKSVNGEADLHLFKDDHEDVHVQSWAAWEKIELDAGEGMEAFVIAGGFSEGGEHFAKWDWLRLPPGTRTQAIAGPDGARVWTKSGHLSKMI
ncbi:MULTISPECIES: cupin domain-containing protein [unclassified Ruegeria]|uniref:cupin domain-containing protein n=1 Tax=unclassified Ruegeria TaxID=2625375 RepID=UPI001487D1D8|nr:MULTISPECIES: cupin domain-containing protein [unclassified Ruegeria]NOD75122.1 cupin [Ruegeria sp. HKCCD4332]NOD87083.1 cupin [Ruegeria sp. HKCCD4318]NOE12638.1 cupin [Ruegeria sp. HKCCD4318-2]NOG09197.1 cupin [Ruegeria sp. HKCCD4315]